MKRRIYLNDDWSFTETFTEDFLKEDYEENLTDKNHNLTSVRLPHTCKETPFHYFDESVYQMECGYRRKFFAPNEWLGKQVFMTFEGVAHSCEVFCNGNQVGEHHCGYTAFTVELSSFLNYGEENWIVVKVDSRENQNIPPFGFVIDYMTYGGIYRDVYLEVKQPTHIEDVFVHTSHDFEKETAELTVETSIKLPEDASTKEKLRLRYSLRKKNCGYQNTEVRGSQSMDAIMEPMIWQEEVSSSEKVTLHKSTYTVENPSLWDIDSPSLYELKTELISEETIMDESITTFGFREAVFKTDGFYLNGRKLKIRGLNRHQSYPYVGYAMPESMQKLDADLLKYELGVNAVRTSHYPQSHFFLDRCDEIGLLVFTEIPGWQHIGDDAWKEQAIRNVEDMVKQYRNHTSIILWGVRINESKDDDDFYQRTNEAAHRLDPYRQTGGVRAIKKSNLLEDVYTYNDFVHDGTTRGCEPKKKVTSDNSKPYLVSEFNGHMFPTKTFDKEEQRSEHAIRHANVLDAVMGEEDIAGCFGWCMFDYNTHKDFGSGDRICYHGVMDMFRNRKLSANVYACEQDKEPVLEISSSMDIGEHPGCNRGTIWIFTNADIVRMYKNDRFIKEYSTKASPYRHLKHGPIIVDDFIGDALEKKERFKPKHARELSAAMNLVARGSLSHIPKKIIPTALKLVLLYHMNYAEVSELYTRYIGDWGGTSTSYRFEAVKDGKIVKTLVKEPTSKVHLEANADHTELYEKHSYDTALIRILAKDEHDNILSFYQEPVQLSVEGDIELVGPGVISLHGGMGGAYIRSKGVSGKGILTISAGGVASKKIKFTVTGDNL